MSTDSHGYYSSTAPTSYSIDSFVPYIHSLQDHNYYLSQSLHFLYLGLVLDWPYCLFPVIQESLNLPSSIIFRGH